MVGCVLSQLKPSELYFLRCGSASAFFTAKNVELLGLHPIQSVHALFWSLIIYLVYFGLFY